MLPSTYKGQTTFGSNVVDRYTVHSFAGNFVIAEIKHLTKRPHSRTSTSAGCVLNACVTEDAKPVLAV